MTIAPPPHPAIAHLAALLGGWTGEGRGRWGEGAPFEYREESHFWHVGKPFVAYTQRTVATDDGRPLHAEMGYLRGLADGGVELVLAHPTGFTEVAIGQAASGRITLASISVQRTPSAKTVTRLERGIEVDGDVLHYVLRMATDDGPTRWHLEATLHRTAP